MVRGFCPLVLGVGLAWAAGCGEPASSVSARGRYNSAVAALEAGDGDAAHEGFLAARDQAAADAELRFRVAFNLGITQARKADRLRSANPEEALAALRQSSAWFRDAVRLRPESQDARANLEVVLRRLQGIADELNRGQNGLEPRLDRLISDQRGLGDGIRELLAAVERSGVQAEPRRFHGDFERLAVLQRTLGGELNTVAELAGDELDGLKGKEKLGEKEQARAQQLAHVGAHIEQARAAMADARRRLRRLQGEGAHRRADAALAALKRAREQLWDPVTILKALSEDESALVWHTAALLRHRAAPQKDEESVPAPGWLSPEHLRERQDSISQRLAEILGRLRAWVDAGGDATAAAGPGHGSGRIQEGGGVTQEAVEERRLAETVAAALPHLEEAGAAMAEALAALAAEQLAAAVASERRALLGLGRAVERFADLRTLIELTYRDHRLALILMSPAEAARGGAEAIGAMSGAERLRHIREALATNLDRLARLEGLLAAEADAAAAQGGDDAAAASAAPATQGQEPARQIDAVRETLRLAEQHRAAAAAALMRARSALVRVGGGGGAPPAALAASRQAMVSIEELRRLFFTVVEHVRELARRQADTYDQTAQARSQGDAQRAQTLGPLADDQARHAGLAEALAASMVEQADRGRAASDAAAEKTAAALAEAAPEVQAAAGEMAAAAAALGEANRAAAVSHDLEPTLAAQSRAMEHLENALAILEPPEPQPDQPEKRDGRSQAEKDKELSRREVERRLQAIRDREAERQRQGRQRERARPEPVEKDW